MLKLKNVEVKTQENNLILENISIEIERGTIVGLTGESGAGKTSIIRVILGFLGKGCRLSNGKVSIDNLALKALSPKEKRALCGTTIGYIPQNPMTAFDRQLKIGQQIKETFCTRLKLSKNEARRLIIEKLKEVNLYDYEHILRCKPIELSGGMLQRVIFAILLGLEPKYVLADEPTSALDENNRDLILALLEKQKKVSGILFISHDLVALDRLCEKVVILQKGKFIKETTPKELIEAADQVQLNSTFSDDKRCDREVWQWSNF